MKPPATRRPSPPVEPPTGGYGGGGGSGADGFAGGGAGAFAFAGGFLNNDAGGCLKGGDVVVGGDLGASNHAAALDPFGASPSRGYGQGDDCFGGNGCNTCEAGGAEGCLDWPGPGGRDMLAML